MYPRGSTVIGGHADFLEVRLQYVGRRLRRDPRPVRAIAALVIVGVIGGVFALMSWTLQRFPQLTCTPQRSS